MFSFLLAFWAFVTVYYLPVLAGYTIGGILYAGLKWLLKIVLLRSDLLADTWKPAAHMTDDDKAKAHSERRRQIASDHFGRYEYPPQVRNNKGKLFIWAVFWPINLLYTMLADVAKNLWLWVYNSFGALLQRLSDKILPN